MNMDAWQAQQRAQKQQDRQQKQQAAAALQSYRREGLSKEETQMAELRQQDKQQKIQANEGLQSYRMSTTEATAITPPKQQHPAPANVLSNPAEAMSLRQLQMQEVVAGILKRNYRRVVQYQRWLRNSRSRRHWKPKRRRYPLQQQQPLRATPQ